MLTFAVKLTVLQMRWATVGRPAHLIHRLSIAKMKSKALTVAAKLNVLQMRWATVGRPAHLIHRLSIAKMTLGSIILKDFYRNP